MYKANSEWTVKIFDHHIVKYGEKNQNHLALVMEKMDGSLKDLLEKREGGKFS